jgi:acyl carrier protein
MPLEELFAGILGVDPGSLSDASTPATVDGWDSLMGIQLIMAMQEAYGVLFSTAEIERMGGLGDARRVLAEKGVTA